MKASPGRPSKRAAVVEAAVEVLARRGFADASIQEIAEVAGLVPTGVYYHFATKEELFDSVIRQVYSTVDAVVESVRPYAEAGGADTLRATIEAVWTWADTHPDHAKILYQQLPDATPATRVMRREHEERHVERAFGYLDEASSRFARAVPAQSHAVATLTVRTLIRFQIAILAATAEGGPLEGAATPDVRSQVELLSSRLMFG